MELVYKKNTLYVYLKELQNDASIKMMRTKVGEIMGMYNIDNLVVETNGVDEDIVKSFVGNLQYFV